VSPRTFQKALVCIYIYIYIHTHTHVCIHISKHSHTYKKPCIYRTACVLMNRKSLRCYTLNSRV
jgi:hypothetical protein